jgi:cytosine/adenosine deaminase-related metal-dependent hydrolase
MPDSNGPEADLERTRRDIENWHGAADGRITFRVHPSATYNCHRWFLEACVQIANEYNVGIATHIAESGDEAEKARAVWPQGEVRRAYEIGLMGPTSLFFHSIVLNDEEIQLYAETGTSVAHNPPTNSMLGNCARVPALLAAGVNVGLGTDMPTHDMFSVMRSVSQQQAIMPREMRGLPPFAPFQMCTQGGARALNLQDDIGTLEPGKKADLVTLDLEGNTRLFPLIPEVLLTFITVNGSPGDVSDVMVDGRFLMRNRNVLHLNEKKIIERAQMWNDRFLEYYHAKKAAGEPLIEWIHEEFQPDPA